MTCIVGLVNEGKVYIGADSAAHSNNDISIRADKKVFINDGFLIGFTSSFRMGQLLKYSFYPPKPSQLVEGDDDTLERFMATTFVDHVRDCLKEGGYAQRQNEAESAGQFFVGHQGRLFGIYEDYQVEQVVAPYNAVGSGLQLALGAMYATEGIGMEPKDRITRALGAAEEWTPYVRAPFYVEVI